MEKFDFFGRRQNQCVQILTSITALQREQVDVSTSNTEPQFYENDEHPIDFWRDQDPMYYKSYDPVAYKKAREAAEQAQDSQRNANNINPVFNQ